MNLKYSFLLMLLIVLIGCKDEAYTSDIPKEKLLDLILDVTVAAQAIDGHNNHQRDSVREVYRKQIAEIHDMPMVEIERNLLLLQSKNPTYYKELNDTVIVRIENIERKLNGVKKKKPSKN